MKTTSLMYLMLCLSLPQNSFAQRGVFWLGGFEVGGNVGGYNFKQNKSILVNGYEDGDNDDDGRRSGNHFSVNTSLYYRFSRRLGIEAGLAKTSIDFPLKDSRFQSIHKVSEGADFNAEGNFNPNVSYNTKYIAAHYYVKDSYGLGAQFFFGGGVAFNNINLKSSGAIKSYFDQVSNENLSLNGNLTQSFYSPFIETGIFFYSPHKKFRSFFSLKYSLAPTLFSADYNNTQNGNVQYQDHVTANGSSFSVSYKWGLSLIKPKDQLYTHHFSTRHYKTIQSSKLAIKQKTEHDVLKADLLGCFGYEKHSKASFWLYENKNQYFLEKLDSNLNRAFVEKLNLKSDESGLGKHDWVFVKDLMVKEKITLFTSSGNAESTYIKITAHQFDLNGRENRNSLSVFQMKGSIKSYVHIAWSPDSSKVSVVLFQPKSKLNTSSRFMIKTFDRNLNLLNSANVDLPGIDKINSDAIYLNEVKLDNRGELFMTAVQYEKKNPTRNFRILAYNPGTKKISEVKFDINNISSLQFRDYQDEIYALGFYDEPGKKPDQSHYKGIFYGKINTSQLRIEDVKLSELPKDLGQTSMHIRGHLHYKFVSIINHKSGVILNAEDLSLPESIILTLASIDNDGNLKSISTVKSHSFGYFPWFNEHNNSMCIIFNERIKNIMKENVTDELKLKLEEIKKRRKTAPVLITIDDLGSQTKSLLLPSDSTKTRWIPSLSYPIDNNKILVGKVSGKYRRVKVKDTSR